MARNNAIISIALNGAKNEVCNSFMQLFLPRAKGNSVVTENFAPQLSEVEKQAEKYADCLMNHRFNELTPAVQQMDVRRDRKWTAAKYVIDSELDGPDPERSRAAKSLAKIFASFGKIRKMGYAEQSGAMSSLCTDLLTNHRADLELLGITPLIEHLRSANQDFIDTFQERTDVRSEHQVNETRDVKEALCRAYRVLVYVINGWILVHGIQGLQEFVDGVNELIRQYRQVIGQKPTQGGNEDIFDDDLGDDLEDETPEGDDNTTGGNGDNNNGTTGGNNPSTPDNPSNPNNPNNPTDPDDDPDALKPGPGGDDPDL